MWRVSVSTGSTLSRVSIDSSLAYNREPEDALFNRRQTQFTAIHGCLPVCPSCLSVCLTVWLSVCLTVSWTIQSFFRVSWFYIATTMKGASCVDRLIHFLAVSETGSECSISSSSGHMIYRRRAIQWALKIHSPDGFRCRSPIQQLTAVECTSW